MASNGQGSKESVFVKATQDKSAPHVSESISIAVLSTGTKPSGFLKKLCLIAAVPDPYGYDRRIKWVITTIVALAAATAPMSAGIFYPAIPTMAEDLGVSQTIINLSVAFYLAASSIFPLWWASFSETAGRRMIFIISFFLNIPLTFACGMSPNVGFLIAFRLLAGSAAASGQTVGAGVIADIWKPEERAFAMSIFYLGPLAGPLFLPLIGGALTQQFGWRSVMWFMAAHGASILLLIVLGLPETLSAKHRVQQAPAVDVGRAKRSNENKNRLVQPFKSVAMLRFPAIAITIFIAATAFGTCYILNVSVQAAFSAEPYNYSPTIVGLLFLPSSMGCILASIFGGSWVDRIMIQVAEKAGRYDEQGQLVYFPEDRLGLNGWIALAAYPASLILYGWTMQSGVHWIAPSIAGFLYGLGVMMVFSATTTMAAEFLPNSSSSGVALNNLVRNIFSCMGTIITQPLIDAMGHGWLFTMVGLFAWITGYTGLFLLKRYGTRWRAKIQRSIEGHS